jgi:hypothetical protein
VSPPDPPRDRQVDITTGIYVDDDSTVPTIGTLFFLNFGFCSSDSPGLPRSPTSRFTWRP